MFDETSKKWIGIYKGIVKVIFWFWIIAGVALSIVLLCTGWIVPISILGIIPGVIIAICFLVPNMLIIQFLNNVQAIREKLEEKK